MQIGSSTVSNRLKRIGIGLAGVVAVGVSSSCGSDSSVTPTPTLQIAIISGDKQTALAGQALKQPLVIQVKSSLGDPVAGLDVSWTVLSGNGSVSATNSTTDASGNASVSWTLGDAGQPQTVLAKIASKNVGVPFTATSTSNPTLPEDRVLAVHYDGTTWTASLQDSHSVNTHFYAIWGASGSDVFAVGGSCQGALIERYDGTSWADTPSCPNINPPEDFVSVFGNSATDVFVLETGGTPTSQFSSIRHYDGNAWTQSYSITASFFNPPSKLIHAVWSRAANDVFAVGSNGHVVHYDGTAWSDQSTPTTERLRAVWGDKSSSAVFAVGTNGTILYYDGTSWAAQASGTTQELLGVWGSSPTDVFAVGNGGTVLHYDGTTWSAQSSGTTQPLRAIWGFSGASVFAVGDSSAIAHYDGTGWMAQQLDMRVHFTGVWGSSPSNVFAVGVPR